ncbi:MAG: LacI family DNA-binding transcriptional regulator, partial [Candidatus Ornithospirochaeta sp.]
MAKRVTMTDIAKEAGVSLATVSYIINKRSDQTIAPETIKKVNDAIEKLGYVPNFSARALASSRSMLLGLVIPQTEKEEKMMFSNTFYGEFLSSFEYEARKRG